jgi:hypothetical protein
MTETWASCLYHYYATLKPPQDLPNGIKWLYPQKETDVLQILQRFLQKFYNDPNERTLLLGINPGRFGAGVTGVNFTASKQLTEACGIEHPFKQGSELSAEFIYEMIALYGGVDAFYKNYFIASVCPLGLTKNGKNLNYYDDKTLLIKLRPFIIQSLDTLTSFNVNPDYCICIGGEKNFRFLNLLNEEYKWFKTIRVVPHPRFIMQYKRKSLEKYLSVYLDALQ